MDSSAEIIERIVDTDHLATRLDSRTEVREGTCLHGDVTPSVMFMNMTAVVMAGECSPDE